jgi:hypothetical protein
MTLLLIAAFMIPRRAAAALICSDPMITATIQKKGTTCAAAKQKIVDNTLTMAQDDCTSYGYDLMCGTSTVTYTTACFYDPAQDRYFVSGYRTFRCGFDITDPCPTCLRSN